MQLIADYYSFASPTVTGQWRVQVNGKSWQLGFRGGELVYFEAPDLESDLLSFLHDISALSESNLSVLRSFKSSGREIDQVLAELLGGPDELLALRRKHALHETGRLLCMDATRADFSDLAPQSKQGLGLEALALPYIAFRLQPPQQLLAVLEPCRHRCYRLSRNPKIPVAGLQLDKEALSVAKEFTKPKLLNDLISSWRSGADALVAYSTFLTLLGCEMLSETEPVEAEQPVVFAEEPAPAPVERIRPPSMNSLPRTSSESVERMPTPISVQSAPAAGSIERGSAGGFERAPTGEAPPIADETPSIEDTAAAAAVPPEEADAPPVGQNDATVALFLDAIDSRLLTDAETMLDRLEVHDDRRAILVDYLAANNPRSLDPGAAMTAALAGLQSFTEAHPDDHLGPLLLSRIYKGADNDALARVFAQQAERLGGHTDEVIQWKVD